MHTQYFYTGIELGFCDDLEKQAILQNLKRGAAYAKDLVGLGSKAMDKATLNMLQRGTNSPNKLIRAGTGKALTFSDDMTKRMQRNQALEASYYRSPMSTSIADTAVGITANAAPAIGRAAKSGFNKAKSFGQNLLPKRQPLNSPFNPPPLPAGP